MKRWALITILLLSGTVAIAPAAFGQAGSSLPLALSLDIEPASPSPGETATVHANTPTLDTATTFYDWTVDGVHKADLSGYGNDSIQVTAGPVGSAVRVEVTATGAIGPASHDAITVYPSTVALSWYAQTYTPAWYKGKALPTPNSVVVVTATPHIVINGVAAKPENLIYTWGFENRERLLTGVGKQSFAVRMSDQTDTDQQVRVTIEDMDQRIRRDASVFLTTTQPRAGIYRLTPLGGIDPRASVSASPYFSHDTLDFQAEPFFFPTQSHGDLTFSWQIGGLAPQGNPQNPFITTVEAHDPQLDRLPLSVAVSQPQPNGLVARAIASVLLFFK